MRGKSTPEGAVLRSVLDFCAVNRILAFRMNTGAMRSEYNGKARFMRFGTPGMADVLAFPYRKVLWIECKAQSGRQSDLQKTFEQQVTGEGHHYIVARSTGDVELWLKRALE